MRAKRIICVLLTLVMLMSALPMGALAAGNMPFTDVNRVDWFYDAVEYVYEEGLMSGTGDTTFAPNATTTRGMIVTILHRLEGKPVAYGESFADVAAGAYYADAVAWASDKGIVSGYGNGNFGPNDAITRQQLAAILFRFADLRGRDTKPRALLGDFEDADTVADYAVDAMQWAVAQDLIKGSDGCLNPYGFATRAQVATILERFCNVGGGTLLPGFLFDRDDEDVYTVTFESNGGSAVKEQDVEEGECAEEPEDPTKDGFTFAGWYSDEDLTEAYDFNTAVEEDITLYAKWEATQKVPAEIAELFGFDAEEYDSDGDGLSNYDEIYVVGTDPTVVDTDENGISDADDDADEDFLSNIQEIELGTDPLKTDSDLDGLSDYEEVNEYDTDPCDDDTDEDGLYDGDEVILGLDPLRQKTDGKTFDSERIFTQQLDESNIAESLREEENDAVPSLTVTGSGNINRKVSVQETESTDFSDSRAIVGKAIDINGDSFDEGVLSFDVSNVDVPYITTEDTEETFPAIVVCKYSDDGELQYLETDYEEGMLSAQIGGTGTYFVLNVKNLFDELGIALPTISDISVLSDPEPLMLMSIDAEEDEEQDNANGEAAISLFAFEDEPDTDTVAASADAVKLIRASSGVRAQADIVFIVDTTGSMEDEIYNVKNNMSYFVDALNEKGISAALALIDYEDIEADGYDSTRVHKNGSSNWFYNVDDYKKAISNLSLGWGGDTPECAVDALETARLLDMRASAGKIFVLVTDANYKVDNRYGIPSMAAEIALLKNAGVNCSVVSPSTEQGTYYSLYTATNGVWANIYGNFHEELMELADKIGSDIVGDGYWIYLDGPVPVPVRLDAMPEEGSTVDTDDDGIPDIEELEGAAPSGYIDLDALVSEISRGAITNTDYGMVMMYKYTSSPVEEDSDYDGLKDADETNPVDRLNNSFSGRMLGYYDVADASYTFDYRKFFNSASTRYSNDLCSASLMFANTIYNDCGFDYNSGLKITDITELMEYHGFENVIDYKLANGYNNAEIFAAPYNDDDISEIGIGSHEVTHNGVTKTVLAVIIRGTNGTIEEWSSNFDMGDTETWNVDIHKGFYITEERIKSFVAQYVEAYLSDAEGLTYWITGHSRGAALANILAARLVDEGNSVYAYTFATPSTTIRESRSAAKYNSIFNFANTSDFVTYVPLQEWDFGPFGVTNFMSIEDAGLESEWSKQTGVSNYNALSMSVITLATNRIAKSCCANWDEVHDRAGSQDIDDEQYGYISDRAMRYCDLTERTSIFGNHKGYKLYPSTAFIFQLGAEMLAGSDTEKDNVVALLPELWNSRYTGVILFFLGDAALNWSSFEGMELSDTLVGDGHAPATYYVLTQN